MLPRRVRLSLLAAQVISVATLLRSIAFDRWITVLASLLLIGGAMAARRGKAWGIGLTFATAVWFPVAFAIGIAPAWFCLVGLVGALPFAFTLRPFARFDKGATALLAGIAAATGTAIALAWKELAWSIFQVVPSLAPSGVAQHGLLVTTTLLVVLGIASRSRSRSAPEGARVRIGERVRVGEASEAELIGVLDEPREAEDVEPRRRAL
ncbi:MAG TPA: hypothetical protein VLT33_05385 [Labilithrix sp.]|nr:hypothetical protein [Labilithrix sp.]